MTGLFKKQPQVIQAVSPVDQASTDANKGATDIEKLNKQKKERENAYGKTISDAASVFGNKLTSGGDTTLASGGLLTL